MVLDRNDSPRPLQRRSGDAELLVNTHLFNRRTNEERRSITYFVNLMTLRTQWHPELTLAESIRQVRSAWMEALEHELPIDHLVRLLWPERYEQRWMPAAMAFNMLLVNDTPVLAGGLLRRPELAPPPSFLFFEGMLVAVPHAGGVAMKFWYDQGVFSRVDAEAFVEALLEELRVARG